MGNKKEKTTLVIGASEKSDRYSYKAIVKLRQAGYNVLAFAVRQGHIGDVTFITELPNIAEEIHTITLYINPKIQAEYYTFIVNSTAKRIIFNPGTENNELFNLCTMAGKECLEACTLVMLSIGDY